MTISYDKDFDNTFSDTFSLDEISKQNINKLVSSKIISGYNDGTFRPYNELTRAEVCKMLSLALKARNENIFNKVAQIEGWCSINPETGFESIVKVIEDNVEIVADSGYEVYYNGEFVTKSRTVERIYEEEYITEDGKNGL